MKIMYIQFFLDIDFASNISKFINSFGAQYFKRNSQLFDNAQNNTRPMATSLTWTTMLLNLINSLQKASPPSPSWLFYLTHSYTTVW